VIESTSNALSTFTAGANGDVPPLAAISGSATRLSAPLGMDVNGSGEIAVANVGSNAITFFAAAATGNVAPLTTLSGALTGLSSPGFVAFTPPPVAVTGGARHVSAHRARVTPDGSLTRWRVRYRAQDATRWESTAAEPAGSGGSAVRVRVRLRQLRRRTVYRYRVLAVNPGGTAFGATPSFTTR
jgi:hypothetical protein